MSIKRNAFFNVLKNVSSILFPLITFPYISRVLLPENVGKINFCLSFVSFFSVIATLGIYTYAIRECSKVRDDSIKFNKIANQIYSINILTTIFAYSLLFIIVCSFSELESYRTIIIFQSASILAITLGADWINTAFEDFKFITYRTLFFQVFSLVLMFIFVHQPNDYMLFVYICLISNIGVAVTNIFYRKKYCKLKFIWNIYKEIDWKLHCRPILYLFVMILSQTVFNSVDSTMLGIICGEYEVGIYSTACKISNLINQMVASILFVVIPRLSFYFSKNDYESVNILLRKILGFLITFGLPCAIGCFLLSNDIILLVAGVSYEAASPVLKILMIGFIISLFGGNFLGNVILLSSGKEYYYMIVCLITAFVNVIGNYIVIPKFGVIGASSITSLCSFCIFLLLLVKIDKSIKIRNIHRLLISPIVGTALIIIIYFLCKEFINIFVRLFLTILISAISYIIILFLLKNELLTQYIRFKFK